MEADWEFDVSTESPILDAQWTGFVNLQAVPARVRELAEIRHFPALADALVAINTSGSGLWTSKCDVWTLDSIDPYEFEAPVESAITGIACYIDLLPANPEELWPTLDATAEWCRVVCRRLHLLPVRQCRVDFIIRQAFLRAGSSGLGITAYVAACGRSEDNARAALAAALQTFSQQVTRPVDYEDIASKYNGNNAGE